MALGTLREVRQETIIVQTTDATTTSLWEYDTRGGPGAGAPGSGTHGLYTVKVNCIAVTEPLGAALVYEARASFLNTGSVAQIGSTTGLTSHKTVALPAWTVIIDTDGSDIIRVRVTGQAATTINWMADATLMMYEV